jgi:AcrR family transcriptional regulator
MIISRILNRFANQHERVLSKAGLDADALTEQIVSFVNGGILADGFPAHGLPERALKTFPVLEISGSNLDLILRSLTLAFDERGFTATSIPEVAASIGLSKTSLYRFATSKEELLFLCSQRSLDLLHQVRQISKIITANPLESLLHNLYFERYLANSPPGPLLKTAIHQFLTPEHQRVVGERHIATRYEMITLLERGISEGCIRSLNAQAVQPMLNAASRLRFTSEDNELGAGLMDDTAKFVLYGIARYPNQPSGA